MRRRKKEREREIMHNSSVFTDKLIILSLRASNLYLLFQSNNIIDTVGKLRIYLLGKQYHPKAAENQVFDQKIRFLHKWTIEITDSK